MSKNKEAKNRIYAILDHLKLDYIFHTNFVFFSLEKDIRKLGKTMLEKGYELEDLFLHSMIGVELVRGLLKDIFSQKVYLSMNIIFFDNYISSFYSSSKIPAIGTY